MREIAIVAGEVSGDLHAAKLVREINAIDPSLKFFGLGGPAMSSAGVEVHFDLTRLAVMGFVEVVRNYFFFKRLLLWMDYQLEKRKPSALVLVDFPGFNLRLAEKAKCRGVPVIYYISPQVWAWRPGRIEKIKALVKKMIVILPFEKAFYDGFGMDVTYVGHPLLDGETFSKTFRTPVPGASRIIGILPGSRETEVASLLPVMLESAGGIGKEFPDARFLIFKAPGVSAGVINTGIEKAGFCVQVVEGMNYEKISECSLLLVASGTASLEIGLLCRPMVVLYRTRWLSYLIFRHFILVRYISLVNLILGRQVVPEFVQSNAKPEKIIAGCLEILKNKSVMDNMISGLKELRDRIGPSGASRRAAEEIINTI